MDETQYTLALAATFAAAALSEALRYWIRESGIASDLVVAQPDQLLDHLREADGVLRTSSIDLGVMVIRFSDLGPDERVIEARIDALAQNVRLAASRRTGPLLIVRCADADEGEREARWEDRLRGAVGDLSNVEFVGAGDVAELGAHAGSVGPGTADEEYCAAIGTAIARRVRARRAHPRSVLVLDCDGTLWRGPCGETHPRDIKLDKRHHEVQQFARDRRRLGWTLALCGRCDAHFVRRAFEAHPEWPLSLSDFDRVLVGWAPKAEQVGALTRDIGARAEEMVVIDDDRADCASVAAAHPGALVLPLPTRDATRPFLRHVWAFDRPPTGQPATLGVASAQPRPTAEACPKIDVRLATGDEFAAVASLSQRARLNATGARVSVEELAWFTALKGRAVVALAADGQDDLIAAARTREVAGAIRVEDWWMDHPFGSGVVEPHLLRALGRMAVVAGLERIEVACVRTRASESVRRYLEGRGAVRHEHEYHISLAAALSATDDRCGCAPCDAGRPAAWTASGAGDSAGHRPAGLLKAVRSAATRTIAHSKPTFRLPATDAERWVAGVWREVLGVDRVGADDDFFALGGDSLAAARAMARIRAAFGVDLPVTTLFDEPTVAALAGRLVGARIAGSDPVLVRNLLEEEGLREGSND